MARNDKSFQEAKAWFKLSNYDGLKTFSPAQWGDQIARRSIIQDALDGGDQSVLDREVPRLTTDPLTHWGFGYSTDYVRDLRLKDLDGLVKARQDQSQTTFSPENKASDIHETLGRFGHLIIDLNAQDKTLTAMFSSWLASQRNAMSPQFTPPEGIGSPTLINWRRTGVLPYFDLVAWAKWSGNHLTHENLMALLPPELSGGDLRTVKRNVKNAIFMGNAVSLVKIETVA